MGAVALANRHGPARETARAMSQENVEIVREAVAALNERDLDRYLPCCAGDIQLLLPTAPIEGAYEGAAGVRRFSADLQDAMPDFRLEVERLQAIGPDQVLAFSGPRRTHEPPASRPR